MNLDNVVFINNLPNIDLHGYDSDSAKVAINDFINDSIKMKNEVILIIHGIGKGILRRTCHEILAKNQNVLEYKTYYYNNGCTIVRLSI